MAGPSALFDMALMKNFAFGDRLRAQFRWELFNAFNHPQFGLPGSSLGASGFGIPTATGRRCRSTRSNRCP